MPIIYLSPSTQENNLYVTGGTEEEWMNRLADAMVPYLVSSGIRFNRCLLYTSNLSFRTSPQTGEESPSIGVSAPESGILRRCAHRL